MELVGKLLPEYAESQRSRPEVPQGELVTLSQEELETLVAEFQRDRAADPDEIDPTPRRPLSLKPRAALLMQMLLFARTSEGRQEFSATCSHVRCQEFRRGLSSPAFAECK
jgi:hypothetical protein